MQKNKDFMQYHYPDFPMKHWYERIKRNGKLIVPVMSHEAPGFVDFCIRCMPEHWRFILSIHYQTGEQRETVRRMMNRRYWHIRESKDGARHTTDEWTVTDLIIAERHALKALGIMTQSKDTWKLYQKYRNKTGRITPSRGYLFRNLDISDTEATALMANGYFDTREIRGLSFDDLMAMKNIGTKKAVCICRALEPYRQKADPARKRRKQ